MLDPLKFLLYNHMLWYDNIVLHNPVNWSISVWPLFIFIWLSFKAYPNFIYWLQSVNCWSNLSSHTRSLSFTAILSEKVSAADPLLSVLDDVLRLDKILSTDGGVLIIDQICLVIPDPCWFPDGFDHNIGHILCSDSPVKMCLWGCQCLSSIKVWIFFSKGSWAGLTNHPYKVI